MAMIPMSLLMGDITSDSTTGLKALLGTKAGDLVVRVFTINYANGAAEDLSGAFGKLIPVNDTILQTAVVTSNVAMKAVIMTPS